ncbi:glycosyltransferase family 2 protein [Kutzneria sp. CA-103260]|uniref:glycosyltransferase family 2 protein n=1 Tax=Kutzneria sp. CA-103260 TaxID=2802641 RepID=UPI001BA7F47D|nr:hypothetical protein [Kutzneria sp. CA-103260]
MTVIDTKPIGLCNVDAIIVPTARSAPYLRRAIELAGKLNCTLVALCSKHSHAGRVAKLAEESDVEAVAVDMASVLPGLLPAFETSDLLAGTTWERRTDTSFKRNLGLLIARLMRWKHIVFLDDDIDIPEPQDLVDAVGLLHDFDAVGLTNGGYPDNSVVCHANRETGGFQETFVGGGALAVNGTCAAFFPEIYNEDWFFILGRSRLCPTAKTKGIAVQKPYDPFTDVRRARAEEFGDCLAEGVFWLLDNGKRVRDADIGYWRQFLNMRQQFITEVLARASVQPMEEKERGPMIAALKAARGRCQTVDPELCVNYLQAWHKDRTRWSTYLKHQEFLFGRRESPTVKDVLRHLGLQAAGRHIQGLSVLRSVC